MIAVIAAVCGFLGAALALAVPFMPIAVKDVTLRWPQSAATANVTAPLVAYAPLDLEATIPCTVATRSVDRDTVIASTIPPSAPNAQKNGLLVTTEATNNEPAPLRITLRNIAVLDVPLARLTGAACVIRIASSAAETTTTVEGVSGISAPVLRGDYRPQIVGVFSDVNAFTATGLTLTAHIDDRFDSSRSPMKLTVIVLACITTLMALVLLTRMDRRPPRRRPHVERYWWRRWSAPDVLVVATLVLWHVIGDLRGRRRRALVVEDLQLVARSAAVGPSVCETRETPRHPRVKPTKVPDVRNPLVAVNHVARRILDR